MPRASPPRRLGARADQRLPGGEYNRAEAFGAYPFDGGQGAGTNMRSVRVIVLSVAFVLLAATAVAAGGQVAGEPIPVPEAATVAVSAETSVFRPLGPCRLADTRLAVAVGAYQRVSSSTIRVGGVGACGIPPDAAALSITVTVADATGGGFITVWPAGQPMPTASVVNFAAGDIRSNGAIVQIGDGGMIDLFASVDAEIVVDLNGAFIASGPTAVVGRFVALPPQRLDDTRPSRFVSPSATLSVPLPTTVPPDAIAVAVNITATEGTTAGFLTAYPAGAVRPFASVLNTSAAGQTRATAAVVPVSAAGFSIFSSSGGHIVVDIAGYFTGPSALPSGDGLFVPMPPERLIDTRSSAPVIHPGGTIEIPIDLGGASAVVANWTMADTSAAGYLTVHPAGTPQPETSSVNATRRGEIVSNLGFAALSTRGVGVFASGGTHLVADLTGWFTGPSISATLAPAPNVAPVAKPFDNRVAYIGDSLTINDLGSGFASIMKALGWNARIDGLPSRNMVLTSRNGVDAIRAMKANGFDPAQWVISLGTNDIDKSCPTSVGWDKRSCFRAWIGQTLAAIGADKDVVWVNVYRADSAAFVQATTDFESVLREFESLGALRVIDFLSWARANPGNFRDDIHLYTVDLCRIRINLITAALADLFGKP